jgi:hypothetical protein
MKGIRVLPLHIVNYNVCAASILYL